jgi:hypothetical protein
MWLMHFGIFDSDGNALAWYDSEPEAHAALRQMGKESGIPGDLALLRFEGEEVVGEAEIATAGTEARFVSFVHPDFENDAGESPLRAVLQSESSTRVLEVVLN